MSQAGKGKSLSIILAAGEGKRMASKLPKVLHPVAGLPMVCHVIRAAKDAGSDHCAIIVGNQAELVADTAKTWTSGVSIHVQQERLGTAHAVLAAREVIGEGWETVLVLNGDVPLLEAKTIVAALQEIDNGADIAVLGFETSDPTGYGRLLVEKGQLVAIREEKDASNEERKVALCNSGIFAFRGKHLLAVLDRIGNDNAQSEYYLPDSVEVGREMGLNIRAVTVPEQDVLGVNDRVQLAEINHLWQERRRRNAMLSGVSMAHPQTVFFTHDTVVHPDVTIEANVVFAEGVTIRSGARIREFSHLEGAEVDEDAVVGPYARLRPGTRVASSAKIGNFVEIKNADIRDGAKVNHLSYIGDAVVGASANVGAGTITCNYDGYRKHLTTIGAGAFIGTNTALIAPVSVGKNANTAAGSVIYEDVPEDALGIERTKQVNLEGKARELRARNKALKEKTAKKN